YQPEWLAGTDLECGAPASDVPGGPRVPRVRDNLELTPSTSGESSAPDELTLTFTETAGEAVDTTRTPFTLVWLGAGRVVGVGQDVWSAPEEPLRVDADGEVSVDVPVVPDTSCLTDPD